MSRTNRLIFTFFLLIGCTSETPSREEIIGIWMSPSGAILKFDEDGSFSAESLPSRYFTVWDWKKKKEIFKQKVNGSGKWTIVKQQGGQIQLNFVNRSDERMFGSMNMLLSRDGRLGMNDTWIIWTWEGDESDNIEFHKKR